MKRKLFVGFGILIILITGIFGILLIPDRDQEDVIVYKDLSGKQIEKIRNQSKPTQKLIKKIDEQSPFNNSHHSHEHLHNEPHLPIASPSPVNFDDVIQDTEVIYPHQELLDSHPVAALRAQAKDSGHWSAKYIPPFPPDDTEANEFARNIYIFNHYNRDPGHTSASNAWKALMELQIDSGIYIEGNEGPGGSRSARLNRYPTPRQDDLVRLTHTYYDTPPYRHEYIMNSTFEWEEFENANAQ